MSVQLVLFPQENPSSEFLVDALDFTTVNSLTSFDLSTSGNTFQSIMQTAPPTSSGTWNIFRNTLNGTPDPPSQLNGNLLINAITSSGLGVFSGVYQNITGTIAGEQYTVTINLTSTVDTVVLGWYNGTQGINYTISAASTQITHNFTAQSDSDTLFIAYLGNDNNDLTISSISVTGATFIKEWQGQVICDLYEDEEIPLTLSVDDFKNVAEKVQSYSKDFNLPATKRNNKIFGNIFEITRTVANPYDFNPYALTRAILKQDGVILFDGTLKLIDIQDRDGEISYNVNLFSQTIALADALKNKTFDDLSFYELEHNYNKTVIRSSWLGALTLNNPLPVGTFAGTAGTSTTAVLKYPFVDWTGQVYFGSGATSGSEPNTPNLDRLETAFRPFIKVKYLLDRIFSEAGYTYSSSIFSAGKFTGLYMDFNWGGNSMPAQISDTSFTGTYDYTFASSQPDQQTDDTFLTAGVFGGSMPGSAPSSEVPDDYQTSGANKYKIIGTNNNQLYDIDYVINLQNTLNNNADQLRLRWVYYDDSESTTNYINESSVPVQAGSTGTLSGNLSVALDVDDELYFQIRGSAGFSGSHCQISKNIDTVITYNVSSAVVTTSRLNALRGEISQWEFLKGIMTMFNLITLQDKTDPANIIIEPYGDVFIKTTSGTTLAERSIQDDWTHKVDLKDIKLTPLNDLKKETVFKFEEDDDDYAFNLYKTSTKGFLYGSKVFDASGLTLLEGTEEVVATPFSATVCKPLFEQLGQFIIPSIYSLNSDGTTEGFDNNPRILYDHSPSGGIDLGYTYFIPAQNGVTFENTQILYTFSHLSDIPTQTDTDDYNFGECQLIPPIGQAPISNLFNNYWLPYYNELYNPDTKTMELKVNLSAGDIANFKFTNYVMIKNRAYRVNRIDYKPKDLSTVEFILIG
tara:strand:+ start:2459 stop:5203 length:2745 start_codon:yes stop_codon:yes gene_type:complete